MDVNFDIIKLKIIRLSFGVKPNIRIMVIVINIVNMIIAVGELQNVFTEKTNNSETSVTKVARPTTFDI